MVDLIHSSPQRVRFGLFEVDLQAGELWKAGRRRKLTGQQFLVLAILLERPGEVVSREELQKRLWPDTFVDVDHNLNAAINKIREALDDSADHPRFVETLSRRGYRFIAPVESAQPAASGPNGAASASSIAFEAGSAGAANANVPPTKQITPLPASVEATVPTAVEAPPISAASSKFPTWARIVGWSLAAVTAPMLAWFRRPTLPSPLVTGTTQLTQDGTQKLYGEQFFTPPLLTDGSRIYYARITSDLHSTSLMQISTEGGEAVPIDIPFPFEWVSDISPNQSEMLIEESTGAWSRDRLWLLNLPGGEPRRVGNFLVADATWSPDGTAIYYSSGPDIYKVNADGSNSRKILTVSGSPFWLRFSPDGRVLRFSVQDQNLLTSSLWEAAADGSHLGPLLGGWSGRSNECCGNWTSDGKYFIFQSMTRYGVSNLWATREKGDLWHKVSREPVQLTLGQMNAQAALPSRDGKKVFFIGSTRRGELVRYDPETRAFTPYLSGPSTDGLAFTRDGTRVAYVSHPDGVLWQSKINGSDRRKLTFPPAVVGLPQWSPDGTQIAFTARDPGKTWQIFVMQADGGVPRQLTSGKFDSVDPTWSPDGNSLAFGRLDSTDTGRDVNDPNENTLHIVNVRTRQITTVPGSAGLFSPRWSPDGRYLAALTNDISKLVLYDFTTGHWQELTKMELGYPCWSHDGKCVYFTALVKGRLPVYRICLSDRRLERITDLSLAGHLAMGQFGWWTGLGPNDSILAVRDTGIEEIYALDVKFP